jgi:hypothetical protein
VAAAPSAVVPLDDGLVEGSSAEVASAADAVVVGLAFLVVGGGGSGLGAGGGGGPPPPKDQSP